MTIFTKTLAAGAILAAGLECGPHKSMAKALNEKVNQAPIAVGLAKTRGGKLMAMETFASKDGSWTLMLTNDQGISCIIAHGENYEDVPESARSLIGRPS